MTSETNYSGKLRAVFLAAIMLVSVVGASMAFTGTVAAADGQPQWDNNNPYQGQVITNDSASASGFDDDEALTIRRVDSFTDTGNVSSSQAVRDIFANGSGFVEIDTADLESGQYFVEDDDRTTVTRSDVTQSDTFEVRTQTFSATDFDADEVTDSGQDSTTELDIDSNRGTSTILVDAGGDLSETDLAGIHIGTTNVNTNALGGNSNFTVDSAAAGDGALTVSAGSADNMTVSKYVELLTTVRNGTTFEDDDLEEDLQIAAGDNIAASTSFNGNDVTITNADGNGNDLTVDLSATTWADLATPNTNTEDLDVNPFNALLLNENTDDADSTVLMLDLRDTAADVDFAGTDAGDYTFNFNVEDTEASGSDDITVVEEDQAADFSQGIYTQTAGDIVEVQFELEDTDNAYVQFGDADSDFADVLYIEADDASEPVSFQMNTRTVGASGADDVYAEGDNVDVFYSATVLEHNGETLAEQTETGDNVFYDEDSEVNYNFSEYVEALGITDSADGAAQLTRPIQPTDYELVASSAGDNDVNNAAFLVNGDDESEAANELDSAAVELTVPSVEGINTWVAPSSTADEDDTPDELLDVVSERSDVAIDDRLIVEYQATGLTGAMVANSSDDFDILEEGASADLIAATFGDVDAGQFGEDGVRFNIESEDQIGNQDPVSVALETISDTGDGMVVFDEANERFFLVIDTSNGDNFRNGDPADGESFTAELEYQTDGDTRPVYQGGSEAGTPSDFGETRDAASDDVTGFPYFSADSDQLVTAELTFQDASISFDNVDSEDRVQAENIEDAVITGTTNVAPGSDAEIRVSSTDASTSFRNGQSVNITEDGSVSAEFDFSDQEVEDEFETTFRSASANVDTVDSIIVEEGAITDGAPEEDDSTNETDTEDDSTEDDMTEDDSTEDDSTNESTDSSTDDETPGFGAIVALVALIGAALLATRRQN